MERIWIWPRRGLLLLVALGALAAPPHEVSAADEGCRQRDGHTKSGMGHGRGHDVEGHMGAGHYLRHLLRHRDAIGLTDEQVRKLQDLQLDFDRTRIRTEAEILVAERELSSLVQDENTELSAIEAKLKQRAGLEASLRLAAIKVRREAASLLNPDQRQKEKQEHERMMRSHGDERQRGGGHDGMGRRGASVGEHD